MKVENIMTQAMITVRPSATLADAARLMWEGDFGFLPAVEEGKLVGVITDRDICIGAAMQERPISQIPVAKVMTGEHFTCRTTDDLEEALHTMADHRVHRLPVVDKGGRLKGVLSMNDVLQETKKSPDSADAPATEEVVATLKKIGQHRDLPTATVS